MRSPSVIGLTHRMRELQELGWSGAAFRVSWEAKRRARLFHLVDRPPRRDRSTVRAIDRAARAWRGRMWFTPGEDARREVLPLLSESAKSALVSAARASMGGRVLCFSDDLRDYGDPIEWHRDPTTQALAPKSVHWSSALAAVKFDVKDLWEVGRFPHAYAMARAAALFPDLRSELGRSLGSQIQHFIRENLFARGVHWASGQEIAFRLFAWSFALPLLLDSTSDEDLARIAGHMHDAAVHIWRHIDYARKATYNNHLLSEATGLMLVAHLLPDTAVSPELRRRGRELFDEGIERQFYADGGYIQQSHNYHRVALQDLLWAISITRAEGEREPAAWRTAGLRSITFLHAQQAPDGRLPNYGNNDGALVSPLTSCDYDDFRPVLQAISVVLTGERLFPAGPWDEEAIWLTGPLPTRPPSPPVRRSTSFAATGHHVLHGAADDTFATFRCGTLLDRFTQMDMLNVDLFWRGENVVADAGTYRYNGAPEWNAHFLGTASHSTVSVDGANQMEHIRQFKMLYPTEAHLLAFRDAGQWALCAGEHYGYRRLSTGVTHRRAVLRISDDLWVVVDTLTGLGAHTLRLHWQLGPYPLRAPATLETPRGDFELAVFDESGERSSLDVAVGQASPPRGWVSRRYARKVAAPSVAVEVTRQLPAQLITVLGEAPLDASFRAGSWRVRSATSRAELEIVDGVPRKVTVGSAPDVAHGDLGNRPLPTPQSPQ